MSRTLQVGDEGPDQSHALERADISPCDEQRGWTTRINNFETAFQRCARPPVKPRDGQMQTGASGDREGIQNG
jgi:hypothetical protein